MLTFVIGRRRFILSDEDSRRHQSDSPLEDVFEGDGRRAVRTSQGTFVDRQRYHLHQFARCRHYRFGLRLSPEQEEPRTFEEDDDRHGGTFKGRRDAQGFARKTYFEG